MSGLAPDQVERALLTAGLVGALPVNLSPALLGAGTSSDKGRRRGPLRPIGTRCPESTQLVLLRYDAGSSGAS